MDVVPVGSKMLPKAEFFQLLSCTPLNPPPTQHCLYEGRKTSPGLLAISQQSSLTSGRSFAYVSRGKHRRGGKQSQRLVARKAAETYSMLGKKRVLFVRF